MIENKLPQGNVMVVDNSPAGLMRVGTASGMKLAELKELFELQKEYEANENRKDYVANMALFKASPPEILKTKHVSYVNNKQQLVEWDHAELGELCEAIISGLSPHGFYHRWDTVLTDKRVSVTCIITHASGHSESTEMNAPPDTSGGKDEIKAVSSTQTILQRQTLMSLTGLAAKGMDNDGSGGGPAPEFVSKEQVLEMSKIIKDKNLDLDKLLAHWKIEDLAAITVDDFPAAMRVLNKAKVRKDDDGNSTV